MGELIKIVEDGNILNLPWITQADIKWAYDVYGAPAEYLRGKLTHKKVSRARMDPALQEPSKSVEMRGDVMHIDGEKFLITVSEPMQLTLQTPIKSESTSALGRALQNQLQVLQERGFVPIKL